MDRKIFPIIGIGASAGGIEPIKQIAKRIPPDFGGALVVILHLPAGHKSAMEALLAEITSLAVAEIREGLLVEPGHLYITPSDAEVLLTAGGNSFTLKTRRSRPLAYLPIDTFFTSLAAELKERAIAVILSGTGSDGSLGAGRIKDEGGLVLAQTLDSAQFPEMPQNAILAGQLDILLPPDEIAEELLRLCQTPEFGGATAKDEDLVITDSNEFKELITLLHVDYGIDFSNYKLNTLKRRIGRQMALNKIGDLAAYLKFVRDNPDHLRQLSQFMLINVTSFFRDHETFAAFASDIIPALVSAKGDAEGLRIWVPGCASGEEAYSIAIVLIEYLQSIKRTLPIQIFATDISRAAIDKARRGIYPFEALEGVSTERVERFFSKVDNKIFQINKSLREHITFSIHNVVSDPPFSRMDLICCRNVLIYFDGTLQDRVLPMFHYALRPGGVLILGKSEMIGRSKDLFLPMDKKHKFFAKDSGRYLKFPNTFVRHYFGVNGDLRGQGDLSGKYMEKKDLKEIHDIIGKMFLPDGFLVNESMGVQQFLGDTGPFLAPNPGMVSHNLMDLLRNELRPLVRLAMHEAVKSGKPITKNDVVIASDGKRQSINLMVRPLPIGDARTCYYIVSFVPEGHGDARLPQEKVAEKKESGRWFGLGRRRRPKSHKGMTVEEEISRLKQQIQDLLTDRDLTNQELRLTNEELLTSNEELQSSNEELATAKEELESSNEELHTVNDELNLRNAELKQASDDLFNLITSAHIAVVLLDSKLHVRHYTAAAERILKLIPADIGQPIDEVNLGLRVEGLRQICLDMIQSGKPSEKQVFDQKGHAFEMNVRPYAKASGHEREGVVITLYDVENLQTDFDKKRQLLSESIVNTVREPLLVLDGALRVQTANRSFYDFFKVDAKETLGVPVYELGNGQWDIAELRSLLRRVIGNNESFDNFKIEHDFTSIGRKIVLLNGRRVDMDMLLLAIEDVTEQRKLQELEQEKIAAVRESQAKTQFLTTMSHELRTPLNAIIGFSDLLLMAAKSGEARPQQMDCLERITFAGRHLLGLVNRLLNIRLIENGNVELRKEQVNLKNLLEDVIAIHQLGVNDRSIKINTSFHLAGSLFIDKDHIIEVCNNLLGNAIKFTPEHGTIDIVAQESPNEVTVSIKDTGPGIAEQDLESIFLPFKQKERSRDYQGNMGVGLGLAVSRRLVELHGGKLTVTSRKGEGSCFTFTLPFAPARQLTHDNPPVAQS